MALLFKKILGRQDNLIIGALHLPPLLGYQKFPGLKAALKNARADLRALERGGAHAVIFENNYDIPHTTIANSATVACMALIGQELRTATTLPLGVNVLWNDYRAALALAKLLDLQFIRVPVFVDDVKTEHGVIIAPGKAVLETRKALQADYVAILADVHVKHAVKLQKRSLATSARLAMRTGADAVIITGAWTGQAPQEDHLKILRRRLPSYPILVGSGVDAHNAAMLLTYANGAIVSTSLKRGNKKGSEANVKPYSCRIDEDRVKKLLARLKDLP